MRHSYRLTVILDREPVSFELRTRLFSPENLQALLCECPVALTVEPHGHALANRLLDAFGREEALFRRATEAANASSANGRWWRYAAPAYARPVDGALPVEAQDLTRHVSHWCERGHATSLAFVNDAALRDDPSFSMLDSVVA